MNKSLQSFRSYKNELHKIKEIEGFLVPGQERCLMVISSKLPPKANIVEIGSFKGKSTACIAIASPDSSKIYAIDTFEGNNKDFSKGVQFVGNNFFDEFKKNLKSINEWGKIIPQKGFSSEIGKKWHKWIDFLFIDGSHLYEDVKKDFELFYPWVKEGGIVALHDVSVGHPGVLKFWKEKVKNELDNYSNVHTLFFGIKHSKTHPAHINQKKVDEIFLESTTKKVFIILPVHNRWRFTKKCLDSIYRQNYLNLEVILVDSGSTDKTIQSAKRIYKDIKIISGKENWWWTKTINEGVRLALETAEEEDFILTMNNDCVVEKDYVRNLVNSSQNNFRSIVGSFVLDAENKNKIIDAGVIMDWKNSHIYGISDRISENKTFLKDKYTITNIDTLPGKGTLIPVEVFKRIGLFREILLPHYTSDFEFFCRAKRKNFNLIVSKRAKLYNYSKETGSEHGNFHHKASYKEVLKTLFSRKSKINIIDHFFFLILCCPRKYLFYNFKIWFFKLLNYILLLFPFYYIKIFLILIRKLFYLIKLTVYRIRIMIKQTVS